MQDGWEVFARGSEQRGYVPVYLCDKCGLASASPRDRLRNSDNSGNRVALAVCQAVYSGVPGAGKVKGGLLCA